MNEKDKEVMMLIELAKKKREKIEAGKSRVDWKTNCSFAFSKDGQRINLRTVSNIDDLITIAGYLISSKEAQEKAAKSLGIDSTFTWMGFTFDDWMSDIKSRVDKVELDKNKADLDRIEAKLNKLVSKELRDKMELDAIKAELGL